MRDLNTLEVMNDEAAKKAQSEANEKVLKVVRGKAWEIRYALPETPYTRGYNQALDELIELLEEKYGKL